MIWDWAFALSVAAPQLKVVQLEAFVLLTSKLRNVVNKEGDEAPSGMQDFISISSH